MNSDFFRGTATQQKAEITLIFDAGTAVQINALGMNLVLDLS